VNDRDTRIDDAFKQIDGALCIWARAKGEQPLKQGYLTEVTPCVRRILIGDTVYQCILTVADDETK
jgi:hypothetical protein